jgi:NADPH:quinone reductase-like Zn-dependent oxidoreductase
MSFRDPQDHVIDVQTACFEVRTKDVDMVIDTIGGDTLDRSFAVLKAGGMLVSSVVRPGQDKAMRHRVRGVFALVTLTTTGLTTIAELLYSGQLTTHVDELLRFAEARLAHWMMAGEPHMRGKIVLVLEG